VLLFVGGFFIGVPLAATIDLPFPRVWIATKDEGVALEGVPLQGQLVAHRDGFCHLFSDKDNEFLSIPDERVITVRIHEKGAEPTVDKEALAFSLIGSTLVIVWGIIWLAIGGVWGYAIGAAAALLIIAYAIHRVRKQSQHRQNKRGNEE
jgi:hypothetical protein